MDTTCEATRTRTRGDNSIEPATVFPLVFAGWAVLGAAVTFASPTLTRQIGRGLSKA